MIDPKLSVVIPVYNEKATIDEILRRVIETPFRKEIVLVDDCSDRRHSPDPGKNGAAAICRRSPGSRF
jgi:cellulose synthase/poly-beta-1,6-N-acetylglucosamine synthase-like glycosyltransferase